MASTSSTPSVLHLRPPPIPHGGVSTWSASGRSLGMTMNPATAELAAFVKPREKNEKEVPQTGGAQGDDWDQPLKIDGVFDQDTAVFFGKWAQMQNNLNKFHADSHAIFVSLQGLYGSHIRGLNLPHPPHSSSVAPRNAFLSLSSSTAGPSALSALSHSTFGFQTEGDQISSFGLGAGAGTGGSIRPGPQQVLFYRRIADEYGSRLQEVSRDREIDPNTRAHHHAICRSFQLASTLYVPADGTGLSVVGEELLDWWNAYGDPNGAGELADACKKIIAIGDVWDHEDFQEVVIKSILRGLMREMTIPLLEDLDSHSQPSVVAFSKILIDNISTFPRSTDVSAYPNETSFTFAHQKWRANFKAEVSTHTKGKERTGGWLEYRDIPGQQISGDEKREESRAWEGFFIGLVDLLTGVEEKVEMECQDWRSLVCVWGVLVDPRIKREDLPYIVDRVQDQLPVDTTMVEEDIHLNLLSGEITKAVIGCNELDIWLAAHLTDLLDKMGLVEDDEEAFELPLRDYFVMSYTDVLQANPAYWSIACDYLERCGEPGIGRIKAIVRRVGLETFVSEGSEDQASQKSKGKDSAAKRPDFGKIEEVLKVCTSNNLEEELKEICRAATQVLFRSGYYGEAVSFCMRSGDQRLLSVIAEEILDIYVKQGPDAYLAAVATIPASLLTQRAQRKLFDNASMMDDRDDNGTVITNADMSFASGSRLTFLARFREFLDAFSIGDHALAAQILVKLFESGLVPQRFWAVLLIDSLQLLESDEVLFSVADTFELMRHMEEITIGSSYAPELYLKSLFEITKGRQPSNDAISQSNADDTPLSGEDRFMKSRKEQERIRQEEEKGMLEALKALDAFKLAAVRNISRASIRAS